MTFRNEIVLKIKGQLISLILFIEFLILQERFIKHLREKSIHLFNYIITELILAEIIENSFFC